VCGLFGVGVDDPRRSPSTERLLQAARTIEHRGPDDDGAHVAGPLGVAFRRLSIIDLAGGHQPILNETGEIAIALNGEVYNYRELRPGLKERGHVFRTDGDVEVVLHAYEEYGEDVCQHMVGMFAFAILDSREPGRPKLFIARDRLGIKPMYWARTAEGLSYGSETKTLLAWGGIERRMAPEKLLDYMVQGYVGGEQSAWAGIQRLRPGCSLTWSPGEEPRIRRYWDLPLEELRDVSGADELNEEILEWLDRCVRDRLVADVPLGAFLSGGIDSTSVVDSMARIAEKAVIACSVGFHEKSHDELDVARRTARALGAEHHTQVLEADPRLAVDTLPWFYDEPLADPSTVPTYLVSKMAREHVTVALSGDGGDETFAGYRRYVHDHAENRVRRRIGAAGRTALATAGRHYPKLDWAPRVFRARTFLTNVGREPARAYWHSVTQLAREDALSLLAPDLAHSLADHDPFDAFRAHYERPAIDDPLYRAQYADFHTYLPDQILAKVDRASMAVSLEVRVPILDHRFVERFANLPASWKVQGGRGKHAFREALRKRVDGGVLDGTKRGFDTPLRAWIRGPLAGSVREAIESLPGDWFRREALQQRLDEHSSGARDHGRLLWSLMVLEHWRRRHEVVGLAS
jgi:asparagine synthase (glutamine-hydrolysing)